jgi:hypothetical protein
MKNKNDVLSGNQSHPEGAESEKWKIPKRKKSLLWIYSAL